MLFFGFNKEFKSKIYSNFYKKVVSILQFDLTLSSSFDREKLIRCRIIRRG